MIHRTCKFACVCVGPYEYNHTHVLGRPEICLYQNFPSNGDDFSFIFLLYFLNTYKIPNYTQTFLKVLIISHYIYKIGGVAFFTFTIVRQSHLKIVSEFALPFQPSTNLSNVQIQIKYSLNVFKLRGLELKNTFNLEKKNIANLAEICKIFCSLKLVGKVLQKMELYTSPFNINKCNMNGPPAKLTD